MKKWSSVLACRLEKPRPLAISTARHGDQARHPAEELLLPQDGHRHEHVGQEVDDVVEAGAVDPGGVTAHVDGTRGKAVGGIHEDGEAQPEEGRRGIVVPRAAQRKPREEGTRRRVGVDRDGGCAAGKGHGSRLV